MNFGTETLPGAIVSWHIQQGIHFFSPRCSTLVHLSYNLFPKTWAPEDTESGLDRRLHYEAAGLKTNDKYGRGSALRVSRDSPLNGGSIKTHSIDRV